MNERKKERKKEGKKAQTNQWYLYIETRQKISLSLSKWVFCKKIIINIYRIRLNPFAKLAS